MHMTWSMLGDVLNGLHWFDWMLIVAYVLGIPAGLWVLMMWDMAER